MFFIYLNIPPFGRAWVGHPSLWEGLGGLSMFFIYLNIPPFGRAWVGFFYYFSS